MAIQSFAHGKINSVAIAILGAGGFLGSNVARALINAGNEVMVVSSSEPVNPARREVWELASTQIVADLRLGQVDLLGCMTVYNFAADMGGVGYFSEAQVGPYISNSRITFNVLEMCASQKVPKVFMSSSACAYPISIQMVEGVAPLLAEDLLESGPADQMYGKEKLMICALSKHLPFDCRVGIIHTVYGDSISTDETRMKLPSAIVRKVLNARTTGQIEIWGNGKQLRSFLWIDDAVEKIIRIMDGPNPGPINIGYQGAVSVLDVVEICTNYLDIHPRIITNTKRPSGVLSRDCSNREFWNLYGPMEKVGYAHGFGMLLDAIAIAEDEF